MIKDLNNIEAQYPETLYGSIKKMMSLLIDFSAGPSIWRSPNRNCRENGGEEKMATHCIRITKKKKKKLKEKKWATRPAIKTQLLGQQLAAPTIRRPWWFQKRNSVVSSALYSLSTVSPIGQTCSRETALQVDRLAIEFLPILPSFTEFFRAIFVSSQVLLRVFLVLYSDIFTRLYLVSPSSSDFEWNFENGSKFSRSWWIEKRLFVVSSALDSPSTAPTRSNLFQRNGCTSGPAGRSEFPLNFEAINHSCIGF